MSGGAYVFGTPQMTSGAADCSNDAYHNKWWRLANGLKKGTYRLMVSTSDPSRPLQNVSTNAENMFGLQVTQGDEHIVLRMHAQRIEWRRLGHLRMVTGNIAAASRSRSRPAGCACGASLLKSPAKGNSS